MSQLSFTVFTKLIPETKNIMPNTAYTITSLMAWVPPDTFANKIAAYIKPTIPSIVSKAPKILLMFMIL